MNMLNKATESIVLLSDEGCLKEKDSAETLYKKIRSKWGYIYSKEGKNSDYRWYADDFLGGFKDGSMPFSSFISRINDLYSEWKIREVFCYPYMDGKRNYWNSPSDYYNNKMENYFWSIINKMRYIMGKGEDKISFDYIWKILFHVLERSGKNIVSVYWPENTLPEGYEKAAQIPVIDVDKIKNPYKGKHMKILEDIPSPPHGFKSYKDSFVGLSLEYLLWLNSNTYDESDQVFEDMLKLLRR